MHGYTAGGGMDADNEGSIMSGQETRRNSTDSCLFKDDAACAPAQRPGMAPGPPGIREQQMRPWRVGAIYPMVPGRLSFVVHSSDEQTQEQINAFPRKYFFSADFQERYEPFCDDFGPVNLGVVHSFALFMRKYWHCQALQNRELVYYSDDTPESRTNCAFLLSAFLVVEMGYTADQAWAPFSTITGSPFRPFRDATYSPQDYSLSIHACLQGLHRAVLLGWYSPNTFDAGEYDYLDNPGNGDMNMVSPKFMAFKGPKDRCAGPCEVEEFTFPPVHFTEVFRDKGITAVVRLNEPTTYDPEPFTQAGIRHYDLYFDDCTVPSNALVLRFLEICEQEQGVAVHCRAGLGRTGSLIAAYFMKTYGFTASECIGWLRIVRPGSIIGTQQQYLHWLERTLNGSAPCGPASVITDTHVATLQQHQLTHRATPDSAALGVQIAEAQAARARARVAMYAAQEEDAMGCA